MSAVVRIEGEIDIDRPVDEVFDVVADERNEPAYNRRMTAAEKITPGPVGVGTRFAATVRSGRRPLVMTVEYTAYDRPRRLSSRTTMASAEITGTLTFDPVAGGTRMRWAWELRPHGALRLLTPVLRPLGARSEQVIWQGLKHHLESPGAPGETADRAGQTPAG